MMHKYIHLYNSNFLKDIGRTDWRVARALVYVVHKPVNVADGAGGYPDAPARYYYFNDGKIAFYSANHDE